MATNTGADLSAKRCQPCEGGVPPMNEREVRQLLSKLPEWQLGGDGKQIHRTWTLESFKEGIDFINRIADVAEAEQHHPDLCLTDYKQVTVKLCTHAIDGLSENDFIVAAKIDELPS